MTQEEALDILKTGANVFLTGEPGAGKTHVLNQYIAWLDAAGVSAAVTASTGIAATHIGGMTIHSWSGIGIKETLTQNDIEIIASREKISKRITKAKVLIIDEISMLDGRVLEMVDAVCKAVKKSEEPFGGLQVVLVGDFFQLPPIAGKGEVSRFAFESRSWDEAQLLICYISEQYRHEDEMLSGLLGAIRKNDIDESHYTLLSEQTDIAFEDIEPTKLYTHNIDVDAVNREKLSSLKGSVRTFSMTAKGAKQIAAGLARNCLSPEVLELKEEAMVMCTKNNFEAGYVNGTLARVVTFDGTDGFPIIETTEGSRIKIEPTSWEMREEDKVLAEISQLPLRLAWAITVHKSQGMSLDAAEIDLSKAFVYGQGYVALSRVRTLSGLKMIGIGPNALHIDPKVLARDERFKNESNAAEEAFQGMDAEELLSMHTKFVTAQGGKIPTETEVKRGAKKKRQVSEDTYSTTLSLLQSGKSIAAIAKERDMTQSTVWTHLEKLEERKSLSVNDIDHLLEEEWEKNFEEIHACFNKQDDEKLKPVFEALSERYDYETIRLARLYMKLI